MTELERIRERLRWAIACAPLALGCPAAHAGEPDAGAAPQAPQASQAAQPAPATPRVPPGPPPHLHMPSCPNGNWCGSAKEVQPLADPEATTKLGCVTEARSGQGKPAPKSWPMGPEAYVVIHLDEVATQAKRDVKDADTCCYTWVRPCPGGRPLLSEGRALLASVERRAGEAPLEPGVAALPEGLRSALAEAWLADALSEHASIASFARAALELLAAGGPLELVADCQRAGLDEVRHAERCLALAERYAGERLSLGALPAAAPRPGGLARLAADTFAEGCAGETLSALAAARALRGCADERVASVLRGLVADEQRHAELAWRTLAWAVRAGGPEVAAAVRAEAARLRPAPASGAEPRAELWAQGRLDEAAQAALAAQGWAELVLPLLAEVVGAPV